MGVVEEFNRSAHLYDRFSQLQVMVGRELIELIPDSFQPRSILDLGSGTGGLSQELFQRFVPAEFVGIDASPSMITIARSRGFGRWLVGDLEDEFLWERLGQFDLVFSNSVLHWIGDKKALFSRIKEHLKPNGVFAFSIFGPRTMQEVGEVLGVDIPAREFTSLSQIKEVLVALGFDVKFESKLIVWQYNSLLDFLRFVKGTGVRTDRKFMLPSRLRRAEREMRSRFGGINVSYEVGLFLARPI